ncbi:hypothetical protein ATCC90586_010242 [Pythium insidiosum]|nr:hypothetical protein ATCC90586_010242 [Pythium insidiosum]
MVSTLAAQLQQLREGGAGSKRKTDTFLYDAREAAQIDDETVYNLAWNGLLELRQLDAAFEEFDPSRDPARLFSRQRIHFHRVQLTKSEEAEINAALSKLLDALSAYFLLGATHKVLEFLVRRYEIHRYNVNDVMAMIISYHESKWFAKMVTILHIANTRWEFLLRVKQTGEPLLRQALVQRALDESSVVEFIFTSAARIGAANPKLISLYALIVLQMLEQCTVNESMLRWLLPELLTALKTKAFPEMQAAAYMVLTKLSSKAVLSAKVVDTLVKHLVKYAQKVAGGASTGGTQLNALLCVIYMAETQPSFDLSPGVGKYLVAMDGLVDCLSDVASTYESVTFVRALTQYLISSMEKPEDSYHDLLVNMIPRVAVVEHVVGAMVTQLLTLAADNGFDLKRERVTAVSAILVALCKKHVGRCDESVQAFVASVAPSSKKNLQTYLQHTFSQVANSAHFIPADVDAKTSLALALDHPTESTRFQAIQSLEKQHTETSASGGAHVLSSPSILLRRLQDDTMFVDLLAAELARDDGGIIPSAVTKTRHRDAADAKEYEFFQGLSCILEVLAVKIDDVAMDSGADALLRTLSDVLEHLCHPDHAERVSEYVLQVVFGCLRRLCEVHAITKPAIEVSNGKKTKKSKGMNQGEVEPGTLVKHTLTCLARTASPQTRNEALLFISALVNVYPTSVLSSLEKIMSFVGAGAMHQDDDYSFNVLETIIKSVVPHIVNEASTPGANDVVSVQQFIRIFVDAYDHIPSKRRQMLFHVVVQSLGDRYLPYVVVALLESAVLSSVAALEERTRFAHQLSTGFSAVAQIAGLVTQLRLVRSLHTHVIDNSDGGNENEAEDEEEDDSAMSDLEQFHWNKGTISSRDIARQLNIAVVRFIPQHLQSRELHHLILQIEDEEEDEDMIDEENVEDIPASTKLQEHYLVLAQIVLLYFRRLTREQAVNEDGVETDATPRGFWAELAQETIEILGALQQLLSTPGFVAVIGELLHHDNSLVRKRAMQLFNERLQVDRDTLTPGEELLFVDMLDELDAILLNEGGSENTVNIQTALLSVDILARSFAVKHPKKFQAILPTVMKYVNADFNKKDGKTTTVSTMTLHLMGCAFVSLASICRAIGPVVFPFLPKFFPTLLDAISFCSSKTSRKRGEDSSSVGGVSTVLQCLLSSLEVFTDHIPQFLTPYLSQIVKVLLLSSLVPNGGNVTAQPLVLTVDSCFVNITNHVELRHLLPNLFGAYDVALAQGDRSVVRLLAVISTVVTSLQSSDLRQYLPVFARFFVTSLDLRRVHSAKLHDLDAVEDEALDVLVQFILRLNEKQLKPLFLKIFEWSQHIKTPRGSADRNIVFYKLLVKLSDRLKSIFVPYYAHVLESLALALRESRDALLQKKLHQGGASSDDDDDDFFARDEEDVSTKASSKKRKLMNGSAAASAEVPVPKEVYFLQLQMAVRALNGCFVHDSDSFIDKDHFEVVMSPLVESIDILKTMPDAQSFVFDNVSECIANLAWAAKNDLLWKPLHYAVLMKSRGDCAAVRLATLKVVEKCYTIIGDEFLAMLPESIPFLAELMEDNDAEVERTCHRVIKQIEEISGESLDQYLTA